MRNHLFDDQSGASLAEYALILALIACACFAALQNTDEAVRRKFNVDFVGAVYGNNSPEVESPNNHPGSDNASADDGSLSKNDESGDKKGKKPKQIHPHAGGAGSDNGKGNDDK
jgi:Flp pilus assembly pilin Flp